MQQVFLKADKLAPIVLFVYNRPWHTEQTLNALANNELADQSILFIYVDGPKDNASAYDLDKIAKTREVIRKKQWCKDVAIIESLTNKGLAGSIINGVTEILNKYNKTIVLEDDLVTAPFFLTYMNKNLDLYENNDNVISIHGFMYPIKKKLKTPFFLKGADCWGWGTWKRGWQLFEENAQLLLDKIKENNLEYEFNFNNTYEYTGLLQAQIDNKVDSWAIRWYASAFLANKLTLYPPTSLVKNIGLDGTGTHKDISHNNSLIFDHHIVFPIVEIEAKENKKAKKIIGFLFRGKGYYLKIVKKTFKKFLKMSYDN